MSSHYRNLEPLGRWHTTIYEYTFKSNKREKVSKGSLKLTDVDIHCHDIH